MAQARRAAIKPETDLAGARILIVEARFYEDIADALLQGAIRAIEAAGANFERIMVPGSLEIPTAIAIAVHAAEQRNRPYEGAVALGCVIRGDTLHFDVVAVQSARALMDYAVGHR